MKARILVATLSTLAFATAIAAQAPKDPASYSIGFEIGSNIKQGFTSQGIQVDAPSFAQGIQDSVAGTTPQLTAEQMQAALSQFQNQMMEKAQVQARQAIVANHQALVSATGSPVVGNANSNTTVVEFFDYQCVHCRSMSPVIAQLQKENPNLRIVYKEFPIFGDTSTYASSAALAAAKQGKYEAFHNALMDSTQKLDKDQVLALAKQSGLDVKKLQKDMKDPAIAAELKSNRDLAQAINIGGTPAFIITPTKDLGDKTSSLSFFTPGSTSITNLQQQIATTQNAQGDQTQQAKFPANDQNPAEAPGTWQGV